MDDFSDQPYRVVVDDWERIIDAPSAGDAFRFAVGEWAEEFGDEVAWTGDAPFTVAHAGRAEDGQQLEDLPVDHVEYDFATDGGHRYRVQVYTNGN